MTRILSISLLILLLVSWHDIRAEVCGGRPMGFLAMRSQSPIQQLRFGLLYHPPWVAPSGTLNMYYEHNWKNMWMCKPGYYLIDAEVHELAARGCMGLGRGFEISIEFPLRYVYGGILDKFIEGFHRSLGIDNAMRNDFPRNRFAFEMNNGEGEDGWIYAGNEQLGWNLGNMEMAISYAILGPTGNDISGVVTGHIKFPTGTRTEYFGGQSVDFGISLSTMACWNNFYFYAVPGLAYYTDKKMLNIRLQQVHLSTLLAIEYHPKTGHSSWIGQLIIENGIAKHFSEFSSNTYELMFAHKRSIAEDMTLEIGFLENLFFFDNSPDIGLHLGITQAFNF